MWPLGSIRTAFESAVETAKLDDFHFHDCRHHFASGFMMQGGDLYALKNILGHADMKMTPKYAHLSPSPAGGDAEHRAGVGRDADGPSDHEFSPPSAQASARSPPRS